MAEFEELRLTVNLVDNASAGLQRLRAEIGQLTGAATQMTTAANQAAAGVTNLGNVSKNTIPGVQSLAQQVKVLERSAYDAGRGLTTMATSVLQGGQALPMLAMGLKESVTGLMGLNTQLGTLPAAARLAVVGIGGVAIAVTAVGAAAAIAGVMVFKFAKEADQLSRTAKSLGLSFGELKSAGEEAKRFGGSIESVIQQAAAMQKAQADLQRNGSQLRAQLVGKGLDPNWLQGFAREEEHYKRSNMLRERALQIEQNLIARGRTRGAAREEAAELVEALGGNRNILDQPALRAPDKRWELIEQKSRAVMDIWRRIDEKVMGINFTVMNAGLDAVAKVLEVAEGIFDSIAKSVDVINKGLSLIGTSLSTVILAGLRNVVEMIPGLKPLLLGIEMLGKLKGMAVGGGDDSTANPIRSAPHQKLSGLQGANDNSLYQPASFGGEGAGGELQNIIKGGVFDALVEFAGYARGGGIGGAGGGGGFQNAAFTTGGGGARGGGGGFRSGGGYSVLDQGGGNAAGAAGIPSGGYGGGGGGAAQTSGEAVTAAQGGSDLDRGAYDNMFRGTPLEGKYDKVVEAAKANNVPPSLMAGIIAHETGKGTSNMLRSKNNPAGLMDPATGMSKGKSFESIDAGIEAAGRAIGKNYARGGGTIEGMQKSYAPVGAANDPGGLNKSWVGGVTKYQGQLAAGGSGGGTKTASTNPTEVLQSGRVGGTIPQEFSGDVASMTAAGAGPQNIQAYLKSKGVDVSVATCGQFMAAKVREHGGTPPQNPAVASNWNNFGGRGGAGYSDDPNAINIAVKQGVRTGDTGAHVTAAIPIRDEQGNITGYRGVGVNQGKQGIPGLGRYGRDVVSSIPLDIGTGRGQYQIRHEIPDRPALDRGALSKTTEVNATGKLSVDVNAPPSTKVEASGGGLFKDTTLQRSTQMPHTETGPSASATANSYMASR